MAIDNLWSPFEPEWYQQAFEQYNVKSKELFTIVNSNGSRSSAFRKEAILNNTFNEEKLRDTLKEIYLGSQYNQAAVNHNHTKFYHFTCSVNNVRPVPNTEYAEIKLPTESFISQSLRNKYKLSQFYRQWINVTDLLNNWDIFKFACLLFINRKIYSEYQLRIDDQETIIRFRYSEYWKSQNFKIHVIKFYTGYQCRVKIAKRYLDEHNWFIPYNYFNDPKLASRDTVVVYFNKISNREIERNDGNNKIDIMGDNLEFLEFNNGLDLSNISQANKNIINSEINEWIWMTLLHPMNFHEFPILLPADIVYREYQPDYASVYAKEFGEHRHVKEEEEQKNVYVNLNPPIEDWEDGWRSQIRPMVLSDAFRPNEGDPYEQILLELNEIRDLISRATKLYDELLYCLAEYNEDRFMEIIDEINLVINGIHDKYYLFLESRGIEQNTSYEDLFKEFQNVLYEVRRDKNQYRGFNKRLKDYQEFWKFMYSLLNIPEELCDKFNIAKTISIIGNQRIWEHDHDREFYYSHPIDTSDILCFEYDVEKNVWYPTDTDLSIERHFPDVYTFTSTQDITGKIFKAFIFYYDEKSQGVLMHSNPTINWDEDMKQFQLNQNARSRDIFLEKFYWLGLKSVYKGKIQTKYRWELIEYIQGNIAYERFNELFLNSFEPYFRLGLANYTNHDDYGYALDYAIDKFNERLSSDFMGYKRIANYELYLDKSVVPSYFDYIAQIDDQFDFESRIVRRPRSSFDSYRLLPTLKSTQETVSSLTSDLVGKINSYIADIQERDINIDLTIMRNLLIALNTLDINAKNMYNQTMNLDQDIYSIDDLKSIAEKLQKHLNFTSNIESRLNQLYSNTTSNAAYGTKRQILLELETFLQDTVRGEFLEFGKSINPFDVDAFMLRADNPEYFNEPSKDSNSLIGYINRFESHWNTQTKEARSKLHVALVQFYGIYNPMKSYSISEMQNIYSKLGEINSALIELRVAIYSQWDKKDEYSDPLINRLEYVESQIYDLTEYIYEFIVNMNRIGDRIDFILMKLVALSEYHLSPKENGIVAIIDHGCNSLHTHLGYITSKNDQAAVLDILNTIKITIDDWKRLVNLEEELFIKVAQTSSPNGEGFSSIIAPYNRILSGMIEYLLSTDTEFIPNDEVPTYSQVFEVKDAQVINGGVLNNLGNRIFIPGIGVYSITSTEDGHCTSIESNNVRTTTFRNPMWEHNVFDSITDGDGMGITVKPTLVDSTKIKDDSLLERFINKMMNITYLINQNSMDLNPFNNTTMIETIHRIEDMESDWEYTLNIAIDFLTPEIIDKCEQLMNTCSNAANTLETLIQVRDNFKLKELLEELKALINDGHSLAEEKNELDSIYHYHEDRLITTYNKGMNFYGTGTSWNDEHELESICNEIDYENRLFYRKIIRDRNYPELQSHYDQIHEYTNLILTSINSIYSAREEVSEAISNIEAACENIGELHRDEWYKFSSCSIANGGSGYKPGDIVEIIPELMKDNNGEEIHDNEDIIMNDRLFIQVTSVDDNGSVTFATPLMEYALPYQIYGKRNTFPAFGSGENLIVSIYTKEITAKDSTLLLDELSERQQPDQFNATDLIVFKFPNIYDLPIEYELFLAGKQVQHCIMKHIDGEDASKIDAIYVNANEAMELSRHMLYEKAQNYFIYKMDEIKLLDGGAGYHLGQNIKVSTGNTQLDFTVTELEDGPLGIIKSVEPGSRSLEFNGEDPSSLEASAISDSLSSIDGGAYQTLYTTIPDEGEEVNVYSELDREDKFIREKFPPEESIPAETNIYLGHRVDWNNPTVGMDSVIAQTHPYVNDDELAPDMNYPREKYQLIKSEWIHNDSTFYTDEMNPIASLVSTNVTPNLIVETYSDLPKHLYDWPDANIGKYVLVKKDENNNSHAMMYRIRTFVVSGYIVYEDPQAVDRVWNYFDIDWLNVECYPDMPDIIAQYPSKEWWTKSYRLVKGKVDDGKIERIIEPTKQKGKFIHNLILDDLAVWNYTEKHWEDLNDGNWILSVRESPEEGYGFRLEYQGDINAVMRLYLKKIPPVLQKNASLISNAKFSVHAFIKDEVDTLSRYTKINLGRNIRIRKLFPYKQTENYIIKENQDTLTFKLNQYIHFRNELYAEDIRVYDERNGLYLDPLNSDLFELKIKDISDIQCSQIEKKITISSIMITTAGTGFYDGDVWGYDQVHDIHIFGRVKTDFLHDGAIQEFTLTHYVNAPSDDETIAEFKIRQSENQIGNAAITIIFNTSEGEVVNDGWIHDVTNPMAKLTDTFQLVFKEPPLIGSKYLIEIDKSPKVWTFINPEPQVFPTYLIDEPLNIDNLYVLTDKGRLPLINPSTGKPSLYVRHNVTVYNEEKCIFEIIPTVIILMDICKAYERIEIHKVPYRMKSVYTQRRIPSSGYINLDGKLNKPLSRRYYEFWMNGKLLDDEITIITPTKLFLHGLESLRNFEIIEINRDSNEYFSDVFLEASTNIAGDLLPKWNLTTYLDAALSGELEGNNYTPEEQAMLLAPVWYQVSKDDSSYPDYPENQDNESDILIRMDDYEIASLITTIDAYQFLITDVPSLESVPLNTQALGFKQLGLTEVTPEEVVEYLNKEWEEEISQNIIEKHVVIGANEWYGVAVQLYNEYGYPVFSLDEAAYAIGDNSLLRVNTDTKNIRVVSNKISYDLT